MTTILLPLVSGLLLASGFLLLVRTIGKRYAVQLHAGLLLAAPLFYVTFAGLAESWSGLLLESGGTLLFGGVAIWGLFRKSSTLLALGWGLHPSWDVAFHSTGTGAAYTPEGYVVACIGFDLLLALAIAKGWAGLPARRRTEVPGSGGPSTRPLAVEANR